VAAHAQTDGNTTGYFIVVQGQSARNGGTSASAPLWAALIGRINALLPAGKKVGYLTPLLYQKVKGSAKTLAKLGSSGYALLILMNRFTNSLLQLFGRERVSFSRTIMESVNKAVKKINDFENTAAEIAINKKYDYVICGHIHQPQVKEVCTKDGSVTYLNSGDWIEHLTALEYCYSKWTIYHFDATQFEDSMASETQSELNVITDEVSYYINSLAV